MRGESDLDCALRELYEETGIKKDQLNIITSVKPIVEELTGTNGVHYKHVYFLAELKKNNEIFNKHDDFIKKNSEIGDMNFFYYNDALNIIRDYHCGKLNIIKCIINYYFEIYKNHVDNTINEDEWIVINDYQQSNSTIGISNTSL